MYLGKGKIHYNDEDGFRITIQINQDISDYYRSLIPLTWSLNVIKPRWLAFI